jgi:hypothetical protein
LWFQPVVTPDFASTADADVHGTFADFNNDGRMDVLVNGGQILLGTGGTGFSAPVSTGINGQAVVSGDFNGDGKPDAAFASQSTVIVVLGKGDGTLGAPVDFDVRRLRFH